MSDAEFDAALARSIDEIYRASTVKADAGDRARSRRRRWLLDRQEDMAPQCIRRASGFCGFGCFP